MSGECNICGGQHAEGVCPQALPGSNLAREHGCTCPVIDNHHGAGRGDGNHIYNLDCPLHGSAWEQTPASLYQPPPSDGDEIVYTQVIKDIEERASAGLRKYGTYLKTHNGRDAELDLYQELIDAVMYMRQHLLERDDLRERLADYAHQAWSGWMRYLFTKGGLNENAEWVMNKDSFSRWTRQMHTDYADLSEEEKESDRVEADVILDMLRGDGISSANDDTLTEPDDDTLE